MKKSLIALALTTSFGLAAHAQNIAVVNGKPIPSSRLESIMSSVLERNPEAANMTDEQKAQARQQISERLIEEEILVQEAQRRGLENKAEYKAQIEMYRRQLLTQALMEDFTEKNQPTDADIQAEYDHAVAEIGTKADNQQYQASHILVADEAVAKDLIARINKGDSFADLARMHSQDPGSGAQGGDLGFADPNMYVPEFSQALVKLKKGEMTQEPVKSDFGYHIILLTDIREGAKPNIPPLDDVKDQVAQKVMQDRMQAFQDDLRKKAKIK